MTNLSGYDMIRVSSEERSRNNVPDPVDVHINDRPDADTDLCFVMHVWNDEDRSDRLNRIKSRY